MARGRFTFWLNYDKDEEFLLAEEIDGLKHNRQFVRTIRNGIRLIGDLRKGRVDVLFELFPWVKVEFLVGIQIQDEAALRDKLTRMEKLLADTRTLQLPAGPKPMEVPAFDLPRFDDDEDLFATIEVVPDTTTDCAANFLNSLNALLQ